MKRDFSLSNLNIEHISTISGPFLEAVLLRYVKFLTPSDMNIMQKRTIIHISDAQICECLLIAFPDSVASDFTRLHPSLCAVHCHC